MTGIVLLTLALVWGGCRFGGADWLLFCDTALQLLRLWAACSSNSCSWALIWLGETYLATNKERRIKREYHFRFSYFSIKCDLISSSIRGSNFFRPSYSPKYILEFIALPCVLSSGSNSNYSRTVLALLTFNFFIGKRAHRYRFNSVWGMETSQQTRTMHTTISPVGHIYICWAPLTAFETILIFLLG